MLRGYDQPLGHVSLVTMVWAVVCLPALGVPSLWDIDEGNNVECVREMLQSDNWVVPTFNYQLRTDKPALLYWLQIAAAKWVGLNEWAARLPSALAVLVTLLCVYLLGLRMFSPRVGLLAALVLATSPGVVAAGHFANPDALLLACSTATLLLFWDDHARDGHGWLAGVGLCAGLGVLAKGPVGFVLPAAVAFCFLAFRGELWRLCHLRVLGLLLAVGLVAGPWYGWVAAETRGVWVREFIYVHNLKRASGVMENHSGPFFYYLLVLMPGLLPWSLFLGPALWLNWKERRGEPAVVFLLIWATLYLLVFSIAQTKLPNYILPAYPALGLLVARYLERWLNGEVLVPEWLERVGLFALGLAGVAVLGGLLFLGGFHPPAILRSRVIEGLLPWAALGLILTATAALASWFQDQGRRTAVLTTLTSGAVVFLLLIGVGVLPAIEQSKATKKLAAALPADLKSREARLVAWEYFQPSLVFYCQREIKRVEQVNELLGYMNLPQETYVFLPERLLPVLEKRTKAFDVLARHKDFYTGRMIVVVRNRPMDYGRGVVHQVP
ncbi:MAG: glycosyltransferase family 39 protein [Gemmataceae bacterium]